MIRDLVYDTVVRAGLSCLAVNGDGTVLRAGLRTEGAARGFNPHHPKDKTYYPLTAHLAQTGQILRETNRPANVNDSSRAGGLPGDRSFAFRQSENQSPSAPSPGLRRQGLTRARPGG